MTGKTIFKWIIGIFFLLGGVVGIFNSPLVGLTSILIGLFILPATYKILIEEKAKLKLTSPIKWIITIVGIVIMGMAISSSKASKDKEVDVIVENASKKIDEGKLDESLKLSEMNSFLTERAHKQRKLKHNPYLDFKYGYYYFFIIFY